jgi:hypothetical protein
VLTNSFGNRSSRRQGLLCREARAELDATDRELAGLPATVAGESVALLAAALDGVEVTRVDRLTANLAVRFVGLPGSALYRALLRIEAERASAEADTFVGVVPDVISSPDDRRRDALMDLLARIKAAPGGRGIDTRARRRG